MVHIALLIMQSLAGKLQMRTKYILKNLFSVMKKSTVCSFKFCKLSHCPVCTRRKLLPNEVNSHVKWKHPGKFGFSCQPCNQTFETEHKMMLHMENVHVDPPACEYRDQGFTR